MSNTINNGGHAFPHSLQDLYEPNTAGMTLRDYCACNAPQPPADFFGLETEYSDTAAWYVRWSWFYADAMLRARGEA